MPISTADMLQKIKDRQWALADIDWDAPGAELITDEQRPMLKEFMADVVWVEAMGACGFKALELKVEDPYLKEIYRYFQAEEQRHANAELALMARWGMLDDDEFPEPNIQLRLIMQWLDKNVDKMSLGVLGTLIPMLEVALDGALLQFLLEEIKDPICHETFNKINSDESRHLAVDFHLLEVLGMPRTRQLFINAAATFLSPSVLSGLIQFAPLLSSTRDKMIGIGLPEEKLYRAIRRFADVGDRSPTTPRNPIYQVVKYYGNMVMDRHHPFHRFVGDPLVAITNRYPRNWLKPKPSWTESLAYEPAAA